MRTFRPTRSSSACRRASCATFATTSKPGVTPEFIFVDDHSRDRTPTILRDLAARDPRVKVLRFSKNFGSHKAFTAGLEHSTGDAAVILAADLQDPPETIPQLVEKWRAGAK